MPRLIIESFDPPTSRHAARVRSWFSDHAADELAGRRVWSAAASARGRDEALALGDRLRAGAEGLLVEPLDVREAQPLRHLARRLDAMLSGHAATGPAELGPADRASCAEAAADADAAIGRDIGRDDVVVVHDVEAALAAQAVRGRGAHVVWHLHLDPGRPAETSGVTLAALEFVRRYTGDVDAYIAASTRRPAGGGVRRRVAALMPHADVLASKETLGPDLGSPLAWWSALADVVIEDRAEHVGGRLHVRPAVAVR